MIGDLLPPLIAMAVLAGIAALVWGIRRHKRIQQEHAEQRAARARELGWVYDPTVDGNIDFKLRGTTDGIRWELEYDSDRSSSDSSPKVVWRWPGRPAARIEMALMGAMVDRIAFSSFGRGMLSLARRLGSKEASHPDGEDFYRHAEKVQSDLTVFQKEWVVRARKPALFRPVASYEVAELLTRWPEHGHGRTFRPPAVLHLLYDHEGLTLKCGHGISEMPVLEHLVRLGCAVAVRLRSISVDTHAG